MGPVALSITSVLLIGLMAVLYLSQVGQAAVANQQLQEIQSEQTTLQRQNQDLSQTIAIERSPAYIATQAAKAGLVPENPNNVKIIQIPGLQPLPAPGK
jgi:cell division protein FtsL